MTSSLDLRTYDIDNSRGFLPSTDPLLCLPEPEAAAWEECARELPKLLVTDHIRSYIKKLPPFPLHVLHGEREQRRAMVILSYLGHAYLWGEEDIVQSFPEVLASPWHAVAQKLGRHPVLSYASYALDNWKRIEASGPIALGNIALVQNFLGGIDEEWFVLIHVDIEARAAQVLAGLVGAKVAVRANDDKALTAALASVDRALEEMYITLCRMPEHCDPYIYYNRVRPYIFGWKDHPALPQGILYEGVKEYGGKPQKFRGETGSQSSLMPALDAALEIGHKDDPLRPFLLEMQDYMPPGHRAFINAMEQAPSIRSYVRGKKELQLDMVEKFNSCINWITQFRTKHLEYAAEYILQQHQVRAGNPNQVGTGGTPFMAYLKKHRDETESHKI